MTVTRSIRILHVVHSFSPGGLENGLVNIINHSPEHLTHELCLLTQRGEFFKRLTQPVVYHELHKQPGNDIRLILKLRTLFRNRQVDVVHTRNWSAFDAVLAATLMRRPVLVHGEHGREMSDPYGTIYRRNLARRLFAFRAKKYVAVSEDLYRWLKQNVGIPPRKLMLIPNGVDTERFHPGRDPEMRAKLSIAEDEFVVGTIGRLDPVKNHVGLINAINLLRGDAHKIRLIIVGDGPERGRIENCLRMLSIFPEPLMLGYRSDVHRLYRIFDLFVLNSFAEGMSNTLLEAMASGLPIVCTAVGGNVELIADRENGILVSPGNDMQLAEAILDFILSRRTGETYGSEAREFSVKRLSVQRMVAAYVSLYESLV